MFRSLFLSRCFEMRNAILEREDVHVRRIKLLGLLKLLLCQLELGLLQELVGRQETLTCRIFGRVELCKVLNDIYCLG